MRIAIIQSCYVPWRGFFDLIGRCDEYVIFDRSQYAKRHWHNRNRIRTAAGLEWLTIPVLSKGRYEQPIDEVEIEKPWTEKHWRALELAYRRAPFFEALAPTVRGWYERAGQGKAADRGQLPVPARNRDAPRASVPGSFATPSIPFKAPRPSAFWRSPARPAPIATSVAPRPRPISTSSFATAGIRVEWMSYEGYPEYPQLHGGFEATVSVLDLIFNVGPDAPRYLRAGGA